eukprot:2946525-Prymnesium_polylepis.2
MLDGQCFHPGMKGVGLAAPEHDRPAQRGERCFGPVARAGQRSSHRQPTCAQCRMVGVDERLSPRSAIRLCGFERVVQGVARGRPLADLAFSQWPSAEEPAAPVHE